MSMYVTSVCIEPILAGGNEGWIKVTMKVGCQELSGLTIPAKTDEEREIVRAQFEEFLKRLEKQTEEYVDDANSDSCHNCDRGDCDSCDRQDCNDCERAELSRSRLSKLVTEAEGVLWSLENDSVNELTANCVKMAEALKAIKEEGR